MFELGTTKHWWDAAKKYPMLSRHENTLKPLGYAEAINLIEENGFERILEVGHGTGSFIFELLYDKCEIWGLDDTIRDNAVPEDKLKKYRSDYPKVKFHHGLLGQNNPALPQNYFDMIYSISTIEHVPNEDLAGVFDETFKLLRPGGIVFHSYDVYYGQNVRAVFDAYESAGFEWLKPKETMNVFWEEWLCNADTDMIKSMLPILMTENPMFVAEIYMWQQKREERNRPWNWLSVLTAGRKPLDGEPANRKAQVQVAEPPAKDEKNPEVIAVLTPDEIARFAPRSFTEDFLKAENFDYFTYSKRTHFEFFKKMKYDVELFGIEVDPGNCDLKIYQDLLTFTFIKQNYDRPIKMLDVGGGTSRILEYFKKEHECWNIDKLEGVGNGPLGQDVQTEEIKFVYDYMGNFNKELPDNYFDLVFSISTLEHVPLNDTEAYGNILKDINRVIKPGSYSLHTIDLVWLGEKYVWTNEILNYLFKNQVMINKFIPFDEVIMDPDIFVMSEFYFNNNWRFTTGKTYEEFGKPLSYNFLWKSE
jgi:ubiquinone/menaquinone biosynthesis C-methylase UbiE